jgi:serine/threonine-protein kinase
MASFSPDGQWVVYWAGGKLYKVAMKGGAPIPLCDLKARPFGICWVPDGRIIFGRDGAGLAFLPAAGGTPETLTALDATKESTHRLPHVAPDGPGLVFTTMSSAVGLETRISGCHSKLKAEGAGRGRG